MSAFNSTSSITSVQASPDPEAPLPTLNPSAILAHLQDLEADHVELIAAQDVLNSMAQDVVDAYEQVDDDYEERRTEIAQRMEDLQARAAEAVTLLQSRLGKKKAPRRRQSSRRRRKLDADLDEALFLATMVNIPSIVTSPAESDDHTPEPRLRRTLVPSIVIVDPPEDGRHSDYRDSASISYVTAVTPSPRDSFA